MTSATEESRRDDRDWFAVCAFMCGAVTGAALATLFAPARGRDTRERLFAQARGGRDRIARNVYIERLSKQLEAWSAQIDMLATKAGAATAGAKVDYDTQAADLRSRINDARNTLDRLHTAGGSAWRELAAGADRAWQELRAAVERAASELR